MKEDVKTEEVKEAAREVRRQLEREQEEASKQELKALFEKWGYGL